MCVSKSAAFHSLTVICSLFITTLTHATTLTITLGLQSPSDLSAVQVRKTETFFKLSLYLLVFSSNFLFVCIFYMYLRISITDLCLCPVHILELYLISFTIIFQLLCFEQGHRFNIDGGDRSPQISNDYLIVPTNKLTPPKKKTKKP